jgi:hypothetical protein
MDKTVISLLSDDEKENEGAVGSKPRGDVQEDAEKPLEEQPSLPDLARKDVPSTPASRLDLPDLIGMGDIKRAVQNISPDERLEWDHDKDMILSSASSFGGIRRARKRARSSSPTVSSPAQASTHFRSKTEPLNPQVDPGSELWGRYSLNGSNSLTPQGPSIPALAHIMHTSSPQPSKEGTTPRSVAGFRRANSCGNQFPKRRRVGGSEDGDVFTESANIVPSKLSVLIERVQEGLTQPKRHPTPSGPSRSFNAPKKRPFSDFEDDSPIQEKVTPQEAQQILLNRAVEEALPVQKESSRTVSPEPPGVDSNSSDYGDFDDDELDASLLEVFDSKPEEQISTISNFPSNRLPPDPPPPVAEANRRSAKPPKSLKSTTLKAEDDEFDDSDEDIFTADLENIASKFDKQASSGNIALPVAKEISRPQKIVAVSKGDSDDEFGDDGLDDLDFEVAEAAATQSIQQTGNSLLPVCTRFP